MGSSSHTTYHDRLSGPERVTVTRRHHPLEGECLEVYRDGRKTLVVWLADDSRIRIPRSWTDADGIAEPEAFSPPTTVFTIDALRDLIALVDVVKLRA